MLSVEQLLSDLKRREGGYVDHPNDKGGPTKYGITWKTLQKHLGRPVSKQDVKDLTWEVAKEIYLSDYLYGPRIHTLPEALQPQLFDIAVNSGPRKAVTMLQEVLVLSTFDCDIDGMIGPETREVTRHAYEQMGGYLVNALSEYREHFYEALVASDPKQSVFLRGWIARAREFRVDVGSYTA